MKDLHELLTCFTSCSFAACSCLAHESLKVVEQSISKEQESQEGAGSLLSLPNRVQAQQRAGSLFGRLSREAQQTGSAESRLSVRQALCSARQALCSACSLQALCSGCSAGRTACSLLSLNRACSLLSLNRACSAEPEQSLLSLLSAEPEQSLLSAEPAEQRACSLLSLNREPAQHLMNVPSYQT
jgi:hypothetical protein